MKKILSFVLSLILLSTTAFAGAADELAKVWHNTGSLFSGSGSVLFSTTANGPLTLLDTIPMDEDIGIDIPLLIDGLIGSTAKTDYAFSVSENYQQINLSMNMEFDTPVVLNDNFRLDAWAKTGFWAKIDFSDAENPICLLITKVPFEKNYQYLDFSDLFRQNPGLLPVNNPDEIKAFQQKVTDALLANATITGSKNTYTIQLDNAGAKAYLLEILALSRDYITQSSDANYLCYETYNQILQSTTEMLEQTTLLGENGLTMTVTKNAAGYITTQIEEMHIRFNVFDILESIQKPTKGLTRDDAWVDLTLKADSSLEKHNKTEVIFPELTLENSRRLNQDEDDRSLFLIAKEDPIFRNNHIYFPFQSMAKQGGREISIEQNGDTSTILCPDGTTLQITGDTITHKEEEIFCEVPVLIWENDTVYCLEKILSYLGMMHHSTIFDVDQNSLVSVFCFLLIPEEETPNDTISEEDYESFDDEIYPYIPYELNFYFNIPRPLYIENNIVYMPAYEFAQSLFDGEFTFGPKTMTYTALEENVFDIETLTVYDGESHLLINGNTWYLEAPAREVDGVLNIPLSLAKALGLQASARTTYYAYGEISSNFHLNMPNPDYVENDYYTYIPKTLWVSIYSDQTLYTENGIPYLPLYDLLESMYDGTFTFTEGGLTYTASQTNDYGITTVSANVGDSFVMVDDKKIVLDHPVVSVNDIIRVPLAFPQALGLTPFDIDCYGDSTYYRFTMPNPRAEQNKNDEDNLYDNWFYQMFD